MPGAEYGPGYLMLSVEDVMKAAGKKMEDIGSEGWSRNLGQEVRNSNHPKGLEGESKRFLVSCSQKACDCASAHNCQVQL